jgi:hypothetical protein
MLTPANNGRRAIPIATAKPTTVFQVLLGASETGSGSGFSTMGSVIVLDRCALRCAFLSKNK